MAKPFPNRCRFHLNFLYLLILDRFAEEGLPLSPPYSIHKRSLSLFLSLSLSLSLSHTRTKQVAHLQGQLEFLSVGASKWIEMTHLISVIVAKKLDLVPEKNVDASFCAENQKKTRISANDEIIKFQFSVSDRFASSCQKFVKNRSVRISENNFRRYGTFEKNDRDAKKSVWNS